MYEIAMTLNEPIEEVITVQTGDVPLLQVTLYDMDGTAWDDGYDATLIVGRSYEDPDQWEIADSPEVPAVENVFLFNLMEITYSRGTYWAFVHLHINDEATPLATPEDASYSFKWIRIEVI